MKINLKSRIILNFLPNSANFKRLGFSLHASLTSDMQMYGLNLSAEMIGSITVSRDTILKLSLGSYVNS